MTTGAFGNLGLMCVRQALELGYEVTGFDLDTAKHKQQAESFPNVTTILGDIRDTATCERIVEGVDAIIHNASLLPPMTDDHPDNPLEYVHPKDVAFAMCKAAAEQEAINKVLLIGGGPTCQINQYEFLSAAFNSLGLHLP